MFGGMNEREGAQTSVADPEEVTLRDLFGPDATPAEDARGRVYLPHASERDAMAAPPKRRVTLPNRMNFFHNYPQKWTWESWGKRVEQEWLMMARGIEGVIWGTVGALLGVGLTAVPGVFTSGYPYVVWQPIGAAVGAAIGATIVWRRWKKVFDSHHELTR
jgi:hypothetical protein